MFIHLKLIDLKFMSLSHRYRRIVRLGSSSTLSTCPPPARTCIAREWEMRGAAAQGIQRMRKGSRANHGWQHRYMEINQSSTFCFILDRECFTSRWWQGSVNVCSISGCITNSSQTNFTFFFFARKQTLHWLLENPAASVWRTCLKDAMQQSINCFNILFTYLLSAISHRTLRRCGHYIDIGTTCTHWVGITASARSPTQVPNERRSIVLPATRANL